ncbi:putative DNA-binding transcriptional regulator AlpA [Bradyrhizobium sp. F1.13.1]
MTNITTSGQLPNQPSPIELWDRQAVLEFFGGNKPLHPSTLYRGMVSGIYPRPINTSGNTVRWIASECKGALDRMISARDEPKPPSRRGRKHGASAAKAKTAAEAETTS